MIELLLQAERALTMGLVDRAAALYQQTFEADPRNSIAVVGLARVALERGDDLGAFLLARRALGIDPENVAAQRLAARLSEVLAVRGTVVPEPPAERAAATSTASRAMLAAVDAAAHGPDAPAIDESRPVTDTPPAMSDSPAATAAPAPTDPPRATTPRRPGLLGRLLGRR